MGSAKGEGGSICDGSESGACRERRRNQETRGTNLVKEFLKAEVVKCLTL